ncbi:MAG: V-type ATPase subunit [Candidatus Aenigmarchaeota archaeon]|nr:V-type ATPase subunit [Candidatus Aenigmarchaeota archaeon]
MKRYPYTATRVKVMTSDLLSREDYEKLAGMGYSEIARNLEEGSYQEDILAAAGKAAGVELIERALSTSLARTVEKLQTIANKKEVRSLIETYALKWVLTSLKLVLKVKMGFVTKDEADQLAIPVAPLTAGRREELLRDDLAAVVREVCSLVPADAKRLTGLIEKKDVIALEDAIDAAYYRKLRETALALGAKDPLRRFLLDIIALVDLRAIMRMKAAGKPAPAVASDGLAAVAAARTVDEAFAALGETPYHGLAGVRSLTDLETAADVSLFQHAPRLLHRQPLSASTVFGYLLRKEIEIRNLRLLVHAKAAGLDKAFMDAHLVV